MRTVSATRPSACAAAWITAARCAAPDLMACRPARPAIDPPGVPITSLPRTRALWPVLVRRRVVFAPAIPDRVSSSRSPPRTARTSWRSAPTMLAPLPLVKNWETREASRPSILAT